MKVKVFTLVMNINEVTDAPGKRLVFCLLIVNTFSWGRELPVASILKYNQWHLSGEGDVNWSSLLAVI